MASMISSETIGAYMRASYTVLSPKPFTFKIGEVSLPLLYIHQSHNCESSAFVTAYNPLGVLTPEVGNVVAQKKIEAYLINKKITFIHGVGRDKVGSWPSEQSVLILGVKIEEAKMIGADFRQNAIVWTDSEAKPKLILLR